MKKMKKLFWYIMHRHNTASQLAEMKYLKCTYDEWAGYMNKPVI